MDQYSPGFLEFSIFFVIPFLVESMFPKQTIYRVSYMRTLTIEILETMRARIAFLSFKSRRINFVVSFATPCKITVIISEMWTITFCTFRILNTTNPSRMPPFPTVFALRNTRIHIGTSYHSDNISDIKLPVDYFLSVIVILIILYVDPDDGYIWFVGDLDNSWFWCKNDVVKNVRVFKSAFDVFRWNASIWLVNIVWNSYNFEVGLWLRKSRSSDTIITGLKQIFDVFFNLL